MTREEARQIIATWLVSSKGAKGQRGYIEGWFDEEDAEAFRMAIEALSADAEPKRVLQGYCKGANTIKTIRHEELTQIANTRKAVESADAVQGEWIFNPTDAIDLMFTKPKCSKCGFESSDGGNFCPNCGARMKGGAE